VADLKQCPLVPVSEVGGGVEIGLVLKLKPFIQKADIGIVWRGCHHVSDMSQWNPAHDSRALEPDVIENASVQALHQLRRERGERDLPRAGPIKFLSSCLENAAIREKIPE
jgi:hypothetical protein